MRCQPTASHCCAGKDFEGPGGADLDLLFITTATLGLTADDLAATPEAGGLFMCRPGFRGHAPTPMQGTLAYSQRMIET